MSRFVLFIGLCLMSECRLRLPESAHSSQRSGCTVMMLPKLGGEAFGSRTLFCRFGFQDYWLLADNRSTRAIRFCRYASHSTMASSPLIPCDRNHITVSGPTPTMNSFGGGVAQGN